MQLRLSASHPVTVFCPPPPNPPQADLQSVRNDYTNELAGNALMSLFSSMTHDMNRLSPLQALRALRHT
eukprot:29678-Eustigmatos_ZCMA.PRE.1